MTLALELGGIHDPQVQRALQVIAQQFPVVATGGGGGGAPSGPAGGDLAGTYPNPGIAPLVIVDGDVSASAAIAESKLSLATDAAAGVGSRRTLGTGALQAAAGNDARLSDSRAPNGSAGGDLSGSYPNPQIAAGAIVDADVNAAAAIAKTKLANLDVVNADVNAAAAIAESKLNLATDAAAGTGSRRTLGTTSTSAAAGNRGLPAAGTSGQVLTKNSATDYDVGWTTPSGGVSVATYAAAYNDVTMGGGNLGAALAAGKYILWGGTGGGGDLGAAGAAGGVSTAAAAMYLDPAHWSVAGLTAQLRIHAFCHVGATAPARSIQVGLYAVTTFLNTTISVIGALTGNATTFTTPAANSHTQQAGTAFNAPAAGWYVLVAEVLAGATAASSSTQIGARLQKAHV